MEAKKELATPVQFFFYLAMSSIAAIVNLLVGFSLYALLGLSAGSLYSLSVAIGYLAGMAVNWLLNRVFTFPDSGRRSSAEVRTFVVVALIGLLLTVALAAVMRSSLAPYMAEHIASAGQIFAPSAETTAQIMAVSIVAVYSFFSHKWLTFDRGIRFQVSRLGQSLQKLRRRMGGRPSGIDSSPDVNSGGPLDGAQTIVNRGDF